MCNPAPYWSVHASAGALLLVIIIFSGLFDWSRWIGVVYFAADIPGFLASVTAGNMILQSTAVNTAAGISDPPRCVGHHLRLPCSFSVLPGLLLLGVHLGAVGLTICAGTEVCWAVIGAYCTAQGLVVPDIVTAARQARHPIPDASARGCSCCRGGWHAFGLVPRAAAAANDADQVAFLQPLLVAGLDLQAAYQPSLSVFPRAAFGCNGCKAHATCCHGFGCHPMAPNKQ